MDEVKEKWFAGPFTEIPFNHFVQSPVGLVPKDKDKTRMIFHLSYNFDKGSGIESINAYTPKAACSVWYNDLDCVVAMCLNCLKENKIGSNKQEPEVAIWLAKSDLRSAFRMLPISLTHWKFLVIKGENPRDGKMYYFVDKCLPFGASISCSHFQRFSDALRHVVEYVSKTKRRIMNYLDDYLFIARSRFICNHMVYNFLQICKDINFPVSIDKTVWASTMVDFLGMLVDGVRLVLGIPEDKRVKACEAVEKLSQKRKTTVRELQALAGLLNFLTKVVVLGRAFTWRMYSKYVDIVTQDGHRVCDSWLKPHHHVSLDQEFRSDCEMWLVFLNNPTLFARPWIDFLSLTCTAEQLNFQTDASKNPDLGFGCRFDLEWSFAQWEKGFICDKNPSIAYLELFGLCIGVYIWSHNIRNRRIVVSCDNEAVVMMVNSMASKCKNCMVLLRLLVLRVMQYNFRVFVKHISQVGIEPGLRQPVKVRL